MTTSSLNKRLLQILFGIAMLFSAGTEIYAAAPTNSPAKSATNSAAPPIVIAKSEFAIPATASEGRDPFFPNRALTAATANNTNAASSASYTFMLQGISGTKSKRFALINNRTFEVTEEGDITVGRSKVRVHCVSISEDSVVIEVEGKQQELKLKQGI